MMKFWLNWKFDLGGQDIRIVFNCRTVIHELYLCTGRRTELLLDEETRTLDRLNSTVSGLLFLRIDACVVS